MITEENLIASGWKKIGNTFYPPHGSNGITHVDDKWEIWENHVPREIKLMEEIKNQ